MARVTEVAPDVFQITTFVPDIQLQFHQFLVRDEEPLLYHTGMRGLFPIVRDAVATVLDPATIRWIGFSHFEADECGSLREWQELAPRATPVCSLVGKLVSVDDVLAARPARPLADAETFGTGARRYRFLATPHVPHCWDAGMLYEETSGILFCSDLLHQNGDLEAVTSSDVLGRCEEALRGYQQGPLAHYLPYTAQTGPTLERLAALDPKLLATMHGSSFAGDGAAALRGLASVFQRVLGGSGSA